MNNKNIPLYLLLGVIAVLVVVLLTRTTSKTTVDATQTHTTTNYAKEDNEYTMYAAIATGIGSAFGGMSKMFMM